MILSTNVFPAHLERQTHDYSMVKVLQFHKLHDCSYPEL